LGREIENFNRGEITHNGMGRAVIERRKRMMTRGRESFERRGRAHDGLEQVAIER